MPEKMPITAALPRAEACTNAPTMDLPFISSTVSAQVTPNIAVVASMQ